MVVLDRRAAVSDLVRELGRGEDLLAREHVVAEDPPALADADRGARRDEHRLLVARHALAEEAEVLAAWRRPSISARVSCSGSVGVHVADRVIRAVITPRCGVRCTQPSSRVSAVAARTTRLAISAYRSLLRPASARRRPRWPSGRRREALRLALLPGRFVGHAGEVRRRRRRREASTTTPVAIHPLAGLRPGRTTRDGAPSISTPVTNACSSTSTPASRTSVSQTRFSVSGSYVIPVPAP